MRRDFLQEEKILASERSKLRGKHVLILGNKVFAFSSSQKAQKKLEEFIKRDPTKIPLLTYVPKTDTLILIFF